MGPIFDSLFPPISLFDHFSIPVGQCRRLESVDKWALFDSQGLPLFSFKNLFDITYDDGSLGSEEDVRYAPRRETMVLLLPVFPGGM